MCLLSAEAEMLSKVNLAEGPAQHPSIRAPVISLGALANAAAFEQWRRCLLISTHFETWPKDLASKTATTPLPAVNASASATKSSEE
jgi:hypothetical protein